jgi:hypothetical protein
VQRRILEVLLEQPHREARRALLPEAFAPPAPGAGPSDEDSATDEEDQGQDLLYTTPLQLLQVGACRDEMLLWGREAGVGRPGQPHGSALPLPLCRRAQASVARVAPQAVDLYLSRLRGGGAGRGAAAGVPLLDVPGRRGDDLADDLEGLRQDILEYWEESLEDDA